MKNQKPKQQRARRQRFRQKSHAARTFRKAEGFGEVTTSTARGLHDCVAG